MAEAVAALGGLDVLVNNVGAAHVRSSRRSTTPRGRPRGQLNVMSYVRCTGRRCRTCAAPTQARIVNVASTSGKRPIAGMPDYSVTKAAVLSLSRLLADAHARDGIRCNAVPRPAR